MKGQLSSFIALVIAAFVAGWIVALMFTPASASVDPYQAYCRGWSDGVANVLLGRGEITEASYAEGAPIVDESCLVDVMSDNPNPMFRGPILPGEIK